MEVSEKTGESGVTKMSSAMSESSHEVSVEKTATGAIEQESSLKRSVEQTVEKSVQQTSSQSIQKSVQQSVMENSSSSTLITSSSSSIAPQELDVKPRTLPPTIPMPTAPETNRLEQEIKQDSIKNTLKEIISDIDRVIEQEERTKTSVDPPSLTKPVQAPVPATIIPPTTQSIYSSTPSAKIDQQTITSSTQEITNEYPGYTSRREELIERSEIKESTSPGQKPVDLSKIFTPATDAEEILPQKNRKLYASSAFYSPTLHPTVEDQVELARRISHSLSDISNQQSKGQSMYVNRKKRSVKWVHEGDGKGDVEQYEHSEETKENDYQSMTSSSTTHEKFPLKLLMNPRGQIKDISSAPNQGFSTEGGLLSPDKCAELVTALNAPKGKGAELFAKRRKKSEKWIVDETTAAAQSPSGLPSYGRQMPTSPILPAYSDLGIQRVQLNMHQDMVQDKYAQPRLKLIKTPWEAALESGNASSAFQEVNHQDTQSTGLSMGSQNTYSEVYSKQQSEAPPKRFPISKPSAYIPNSQRDLAYKPSIPQGWGAPPPSLPKGLYVPPEIPLDSYLPPKQAADILPVSPYSKPYQQPPIYVETAPEQESTGFPSIYQQPMQETVSKFPTSSFPPVSPAGLQKKYLNNQSSYKVTNASPTPFNPSPLPYEKLAKFDQPSNAYSSTIAAPIRKPLAIFPTKIRNTSPTPFGISPISPTKTPSYQSTPQMPSPALLSSQQPSPYYNTAPSIRHGDDFSKAPQPYQPPPEDLYYQNAPPRQPVATALPPPTVAVDMSQCQNYNTAPRGWNQMKEYYRPIKFGQPKQVAAMPYTDF